MYIDLDFMQQLEQQLIGKTADLAEQYIVAHEYGHHVQNLLGTNDQVQQAQQSDPATPTSTRWRSSCRPTATPGCGSATSTSRASSSPRSEINEALDAAAGVGDDRIQQQTQGRIDPESWTHGSSEQRRVVHPRLQHRRPDAVRHVQRAVL